MCTHFGVQSTTAMRCPVGALPLNPSQSFAPTPHFFSLISFCGNVHDKKTLDSLVSNIYNKKRDKPFGSSLL